MSVLIETTVGDIVIDLFTKERPRASLNFLKLCKIKYYNFCLFHAIEQNFVAHTGDPSGTGRSGESIFCFLYGEQARYFEAEANPIIKHIKRGTVSMVNNGDNLHGSQFFITLDDNLDYLDAAHTVFGEVADGFHTLAKLNDAICDEQKRPFQDIRIHHTIVLDDPFPDPPGMEIPCRSPSPSLELLANARIGVEENINEEEGKSKEQIMEETEVKEARARAHILEMVGDLRYAEERPPDNVLFVCKLNPVTTDEDLMVIFSRFGPVKECEIIRDRRSGDSLQYAFIEFEQEKDCENAYFKMDNVLIDDRRIHVDFSQSVAKNYQWERRARDAKKVAENNKKSHSSKVDDRRRNEEKHRSNDRHHHHHHHHRQRRRSPDNRHRHR